MKTIVATKVYIPYNTHRDNHTKKWKPVVFVLDKKAKVKQGDQIHFQLDEKLQQAYVVKVCGDGWFELHVRKK